MDMQGKWGTRADFRFSHALGTSSQGTATAAPPRLAGPTAASPPPAGPAPVPPPPPGPAPSPSETGAQPAVLPESLPAAHRTGLVMNDAGSGNDSLKLVDGLLTAVHGLFCKSHKRQQQWEQFARPRGVTRLKFPL